MRKRSKEKERGFERKVKRHRRHYLWVKKGIREVKKRRERYLKQGRDPRRYCQVKGVF